MLGEQCDLFSDEGGDELGDELGDKLGDEDGYKDVDEEHVDDGCGIEYETNDDYDEELDAGDDLDEQVFMGMMVTLMRAMMKLFVWIWMM